LWYRSSQKEEQDRQQRQRQLQRAQAALLELQAPGRRRWRNRWEARQAGQRILEKERVDRWLCLHIDEEIEEEYHQEGPGRPGPRTPYRRVEQRRYRLRFEENGEALAYEARCDGLFPLLTNDKQLSLEEALRKYKYQPFVEKRHEQLKNGFNVMPMWLKNVGRVESMLWLYYVVELVGALVEREVRRAMQERRWSSLPLYPEGRPSEVPTANLVFDVLEGHRRHRLLDPAGQELRRFHDALSPVGQSVLQLLGVDGAAYGLR
jgi:transposase